MSPDPQDLAPVNIAIVGTGHSEGGGVAPTPNGTIASTPGDGPDLKVNVISPIVAVGIRALNAFLTSFMGLVTAAGFGVDILPAASVHDLFVHAGYASLAVAGVATGKNLITIFSRLEGKYPLLTGSI